MSNDPSDWPEVMEDDGTVLREGPVNWWLTILTLPILPLIVAYFVARRLWYKLRKKGTK